MEQAIPPMAKDFDIFGPLIDGPGHQQDATAGREVTNNVESVTPAFEEYERILVMHSGGKDSMACLLHLLDLGVPKAKIEIHHHDIDGREGSTLMDWPCTRAYVEAMGVAFGIPVFFSWKVGGFEREMLRENCGTAPVTFTSGEGTLVTMGGERSKDNTRRKFPQVTASLMTRWCSGVLKIDVASRMLVNDPRFTVGKTLVITGERAEESANRARYAEFEPDRSDNRLGRVTRWIDHWRPVHKWKEAEVWALIEKYGVNPHPAYHVGFGRASCMNCIFGSANQWATIRAIAPEHFSKVSNYEKEFETTIHRTRSVVEQADRGQVHPTALAWKAVAMSHSFTEPFFVSPWVLPAGAFGESCGPI